MKDNNLHLFFESIHKLEENKAEVLKQYFNSESGSRKTYGDYKKWVVENGLQGDMASSTYFNKYGSRLQADADAATSSVTVEDVQKYFEELKKKHPRSSHTVRIINEISALLKDSSKSIARSKFGFLSNDQWGLAFVDMLVEKGFLVEEKQGRVRMLRSAALGESKAPEAPKAPKITTPRTTPVKKAVRKPVAKTKIKLYSSAEEFEKEVIPVFEEISGHTVRSYEVSSREIWKSDPPRYSVSINYETGDRGPRQDHGQDDDWMDEDELYAASAPYYKKWNPRVERIKAGLKKLGYEVFGRVDYDEKGYVDLAFTISQPKVIKQNKQQPSKNPNSLSQILGY